MSYSGADVARGAREELGKALAGLRFRNQHPLSRCVLDFYLPSARLAVEVDARVIVVGSRHPGIIHRVEELFSKSVAASLITGQTRPVLVVPAGRAAPGRRSACRCASR